VKLLSFTYPEIPPTSNHIYIKGAILTPEAREYAERFSHFFVQHYMHAVQGLDAKKIYAIHLRFYFETLINASYRNPKVPAAKRAQTWYKKLDLTNRIKLLEDCIRDALGVDDSHTFVASQEKHMDPKSPRVEFFVHEVDPKLFGIPEEPM
jgi:Holliday junction resolvase RusA-like endonuclease